MRRLIPCLFLLLAACQTGAKPEASADAAAATETTTGTIAGPTVTTAKLDEPKAAKAVVTLPDPIAGGMVDASVETGTAALPVEKPGKKPAKAEPPVEAAPAVVEVETDDPAEPKSEDPDETLDDAVSAEESAPQMPPALKSAEQKRCERQGGSYVAVGGNKEFRTCVKRTRDANKSCDEDSDCQGKCLARSRTCAPIDPLIGCNDILTDYGLTVTECVQ